MRFESKKKLDAHIIFSHKSISPALKKILIMGGGFGGINVLKKIQKSFENQKVSISIVNEENYFLYTPMLPEVVSKMLHPTDVVVPIRKFIKNSKFYQATVSSIDVDQKLVTITRTFDGKVHSLEYDYLVLSLGSRPNFFGNRNMEQNSFTIKSIEDAISLRNHSINMMENAAQTGDLDLQKKFLTFIVVGAGFAGVETIGELNHFIRESVKNYYHTIDPESINMILVSSRDGILPEVNEKVGRDAMKYLKKVGVRILVNTKAVDASEAHVELSNGEVVPCTTLIWSGGIAIDPVITSINSEHGTGGRLLVDDYLRLRDHPEVFALGDCAAILDESTGKDYPPTAQHAVRESDVVAKNLYQMVHNKKKLKKFSYQSKGMMANIGNWVGVVSVLGYNLTGSLALIIWRTYYLLNLPSLEKKIRVGTDWFLDLFLKRDLTLLGKIKSKELYKVDIGKEIPSLKEQLFADI